MKKVSKLMSFVTMGLLSTFSLAEAQCSATSNISVSGLDGVLEWATCLLIKAVPLLITLAMIGFIWGVIQFYLNPENEEKRKKGKNFIIGGLIALFVIVSMWGLVGILTQTFMGKNPTIPVLPE